LEEPREVLASRGRLGVSRNAAPINPPNEVVKTAESSPIGKKAPPDAVKDRLEEVSEAAGSDSARTIAKERV